MDILNWFQARHTPTLDNINICLTALGEYPILFLVVLFVIAYAIIDKQYQKAAVMFGMVSIGLFIVEFLKLTLKVDRPVIIQNLIPNPGGYSFPSGHSTMTMLVYLISTNIIKFRHHNFVLFYALLMSFLIGMTRLYLGVHYPRDVLVGWIIGLILSIIYEYISKYFVDIYRVNIPSSNK